MTKPSLRFALVLALGLVLLVSMTALGVAAPGGKGKGKGKGAEAAAAASQYQYGPAGKQYGKQKITICHKGKTLRVAAPAWKGHQKHGDKLGAC